MNSKTFFKNLFLSTLFFLFNFSFAFAANETLNSGAFIVNMGVVPQTIANGLKPYGMVYDLVNNYHVPVKWVINTSKIKDGIDFTYNSVDYKGGTFIIPFEYRTAAVNARITYWQSQGVVGVTSTVAIAAPVYITLQSMPIWTLDSQNGSIAQAFITSAGIPATAYNFLTPAQLTCCNDIFVLPHADPTWSTHSNLLFWNQTCKGAIWAGCHAVSVLEGLSNPSNAAQTMNFLSLPNLLPYQSHSNGSPPYSYNYPSEPIMQFMGTIDAAQQNGSEQIYMPNAGGSWRPGAKIGVYDPTQVNVPSSSPGPAASLIFGYAFDDSTRGMVMYVGGHNVGSNTADGVAAQRAFFNFSFLASYEKQVVPVITAASDTLIKGSPTSLSMTVPSPALISSYTITWSSSCGGTFSPSATQANVTYTPPIGPNATSCGISVSISDACGRSFTNNKNFVLQCALSVTSTFTNPTCNGSATGSISYTPTGGTAPYNYNWSSGAVTGKGTGTNLTGLIAGVYNVTVTSTDSCSKSFTQTLTDPAALTASTANTNILCAGGSTGAIILTPYGGTSPYSFNWGSGVTSKDRSSLSAGSYNVTVTDVNGCTKNATATLSEPSALSITNTPTNINCFGASTGAINTVVSGGVSPYSFNWGDGVTTQNRTALVAGSYNLTVTDANSCTKTASINITQPVATLTISSNVTNISCGGGTGSISLSGTGGTSPYSYDWGGGISTASRTGLAAGNYSATVTDGNGCTAISSYIVTQPSTPAAPTTSVTQPTCSVATATITVSSPSSGVTYSFDNGATFQASNIKSGLVAGTTYQVVVKDNTSGCISASTPTVVNAQPSTPSAVCSKTDATTVGGNQGTASVTVSGGISPYIYKWSDLSSQMTAKAINLRAGTYTVTVTDANGCTQTCASTINDPTCSNPNCFTATVIKN